MSGRTQLIVNADDFGRSPGINEGIIKARLDGIVTSTTLMVNLPWTEAAVHSAQQLTDFPIGLHLNFCYGVPVSDPGVIRSLVTANGEFESDLSRLLKRAQVEDIRRELMAQIDRFEDMVGSAPSHLDSHKYLHSFEPFASSVAGLARVRGLSMRSTNDEMRAFMRRSGVQTTDRFEGRFHGLDGEGVDLSILGRAISQLRPGTTELMCHPGFVDAWIQDSSYTADRERELEALCSAAVRRQIRDLNVELISFHDI